MGGLGCAYLLGGTDTATMAIASYAGSQALSHLLLVALNPQPLPPKGKVVTPRYF